MSLNKEGPFWRILGHADTCPPSIFSTSLARGSSDAALATRTAAACYLLRGTRHETVECPSVRPSVCPVDRQQQRRPAGLLLRSDAGNRYLMDGCCAAPTCGPRRFWPDCKEVGRACAALVHWLSVTVVRVRGLQEFITYAVMALLFLIAGIVAAARASYFSGAVGATAVSSRDA